MKGTKMEKVIEVKQDVFEELHVVELEERLELVDRCVCRNGE